MAIIRVSGFVGSGKTTLSKLLAEKLGYGYHYTGQIFRDMARERGLSIEEFYEQMQNDPDLEKSVDIKQMQLMLGNDNIVVQGRMAPFLPPFNHIGERSFIRGNSINVFIDVDIAEGARRQLSRQENQGRSLEEMVILSRRRIMTEKKRLKDLYGIENCFDHSKFNVVLNTTKLSIQESLDILLCAIRLNYIEKKYGAVDSLKTA